MSDVFPPRRARRSTRLWLFAPAALLAVVLLASAGGWLYARGRLISEMDARARALRGAGWAAAWTDRTLSGFPFRLKMVLTDVKLQAPGASPGDGGWGVSTPALEAEAYVIFPTHWVFVAPKGLTVMRPVGGPLQITGDALRASLAGLETAPPRIALEGVNLTFAPGAGAKPFSFTTAKHAELDLRPSADKSGDADWLVTMDHGTAAPKSLLRMATPDGASDLATSGRITKVAAATGSGWSERMRTWSAAGGAIRMDHLAFWGGVWEVTSDGASLSVNPADGALTGAFSVAVTVSPEAASGQQPSSPAVAALGAPAGSGIAVPVVFKDGRMRLGPLDVGPAPNLR